MGKASSFLPKSLLLLEEKEPLPEEKFPLPPSLLKELSPEKGLFPKGVSLPSLLPLKDELSSLLPLKSLPLEPAP